MKTPEELRSFFWEEDSKNGFIIRSQYNEIKKALSADNIDWAEAQLIKIKLHAIENTEYYKDYSISDTFPVLTKMDYIENNEAHKAKKGFVGPMHISSTSGSTGIPFSVLQDYKKRQRTIADLKVYGELCDYPTHERMVFLRALHGKKRPKEQEEAENIYYVDTANLDEKNLETMTQAILEKKPRILTSYPSTLTVLAKYIQEKGISSDLFTMRSVLVGGEALSDEDRELLGNVFGCKIYRRYSDQELGIFGQDLADGGNYYLNWGSYYFECLKTESDEPTADGEVGRIVVTDLFNYAFPLIRYDTGDLGIMVRPLDGKLPYFKEVFGRGVDVLYNTKGEMLSPGIICMATWGLEGIRQWQLIQEDEKNYTVKLNCPKPIDTTTLINNYHHVFGDDAVIKVEYVEEIPVTASNKRRAMQCKLKIK